MSGPNAGKDAAERAAAEKFWANVDRTSASGCWPWLGGQSAGRGILKWRNGPELAYRVAYELHTGTAPGGRFVCHHCDNPVCVRPDHLFLGTAGDNHRDMRQKGRGSDPPTFWGESHPLVSIPDAVVREVRERFAGGGVTASALAAELGIPSRTVKDWLRGRVRRAAGGPLREESAA